MISFGRFLIVIASLCAALPVSGAETAREYKVKYLGGPIDSKWVDQEMEFRQDGPVLRASITHVRTPSGPMKFKTKTPQMLEIPISGITRVLYSPIRFNRSQQFGGMTMSPSEVGGSEVGAGAYAVLWSVGYAISSGMHGKSHYVSILWEDDGLRRELLVEIKKDEVMNFITDLDKITGKKTLDLEQEWELTRKDLERNKDKGQRVVFEHESIIGPWKLTPATYHLLYLDKLSGDGVLYFFSKSGIEMKDLVAIVPAAWSVENTAAPRPPKLDDRGNLLTVWLGEKRLDLPSNGVASTKDRK
jgi:hypothetical protein